MNDFAAERDIQRKIMTAVICVGVGCAVIVMLKVVSNLGILRTVRTIDTIGTISREGQHASGCSPDALSAAENYVGTMQSTGFVTSIGESDMFEVSVDEHTWRLTPFTAKKAMAIALSCHVSNGDSQNGPIKFLSSTTNREVGLYSTGSLKVE